MAYKTLRKIRLGNRQGDSQVEAIKEFINQFNLDFLYGAFLNDGEYVDLSSSSKTIPHKLEDKYKGFIVIEIDSAENVFNTRNDQDNRFITLTASGSCKAKIWVF